VGVFTMPKPLTTYDLLSRIDCNSGLFACWPWLGTKQSSGYGIFVANKKIKLAHRWSYEFHNNKILNKKLVVRHTCDNPICCNPMHLLEGTQKENMQDAYERNRKHHKNALKRNVVEQIFRLKLTGMLNKDIANQLNVSRQVVSKYLDFQKTTPLDWKNRLDQLRWN
jgi:hypothetical protein